MPVEMKSPPSHTASAFARSMSMHRSIGWPCSKFYRKHFAVFSGDSNGLFRTQQLEAPHLAAPPALVLHNGSSTIAVGLTPG